MGVNMARTNHNNSSNQQIVTDNRPEKNSDDIIFDQVAGRLDKQHISINSIDTKAALTISFVGAVLAGLVNSSWFLKLNAAYHIVIMTSFGLTAILALVAVLVREFRQDPDPRALVSLYANHSEKYTKGQLTANFVESYYHNAKIITFKSLFLKLALACLALSIVVFTVSLFFSLHSVTIK